MYDADGNRVLGTVGGVTTTYVAGLFEWQAGAVTKYYDGGAIRRSGYGSNNGISYILGDQLGSSSVIVGQNGTAQATNYYYPFGGNRGGSAFSDLTTKRFTGQYHESGLPGGEGLSYYNARWYDAQLGRFISPDTLIPDPSNPQNYNRFSYVSNNPVNRTDPTGHYEACDDGPCRGRGDTRHGVPIHHPRPRPNPRPGCRPYCQYERPSGGYRPVPKPKLPGGTRPIAEKYPKPQGGTQPIRDPFPKIQGGFRPIGGAQSVGPFINTPVVDPFDLTGRKSKITSSKSEEETKGGAYVLLDPDTGEVVYVGRTNDANRRRNEHDRNRRTPSGEPYDFRLVHPTDDYAEQRGLEQHLYGLIR